MALDQPIYVLSGSEPVQRRYLLGRMKETAGEWERFQASETEPSELMQLSLMANLEEPLVRVLDGYESWTPKQRKQLAAIGSEFEGISIVVLANKLGAKDPLRLGLPDSTIIEIESPKRGAFESWLGRQAKIRGIQLADDAARELVIRVGENTELLTSEMKKVAAAHQGQVSLAAVRSLTPLIAQDLAWPWVDSLLAGSNGLKLLAGCEAAGIEPLMMLGALSNRLTLVAWVHLADQQSAGAKDYSWRLAKSASAKWPPSQLNEALRKVAEVDADIKGQSRLGSFLQLARLGNYLANQSSSS